MRTHDSPARALNPVAYAAISVDGITIASREAGDPVNPKLVLLHGFPSSSHQYRNLIPALADRFHVIAPDYPGFGNSDQPDPARFSYTFDKLAEVTEHFLKAKGSSASASSAGLRGSDWLPHHRPPSGVGALADHSEHQCLRRGLHHGVGCDPACALEERGPETEGPLMGLFELDGIKGIYLHGTSDGANQPGQLEHGLPLHGALAFPPSAAGPLLRLSHQRELYPQWQRFLRDRQPRALIFWGQNDIFFTREGGEAYLRDLPNAEMHRLDSGHFAVEDSLDEIARTIRRFYDEKVVPAS